MKKSELDTSAGATVTITSNETSFNWLASSQASYSVAIGFDMLYTIMDFELIAPMTNGHLHTWSLPVTGRYIQNGAEIFYAIRPAVSVSSNAMKNPELIDPNGLQLNAASIYKKHIDTRFAWLLGLMSDHRFGDYQLYPVAGVCWRPTQDWVFQLAVPDFGIRKQWVGGFSLKFYLAPDGQQWRVFSKDQQQNSDFIYKSVVAGITARWSITSNAVVSFDVVKQARRKFSLLLDDSSHIESGAGTGTGLRINAEYLF